MKKFSFSIFIFFALSACGQDSAIAQSKKQLPLSSTDSAIIIRQMSKQLCDCVNSTMKDEKPKKAVDSCLKLMVVHYIDSLNKLGYDSKEQTTLVQVWANMFTLLKTSCPNILQLLSQESSEEQAHGLFFKGKLISERRLPSGLYEIFMKESNSFYSTKTFLSRTPIDTTIINSYVSGCEIRFAYEIRKNPKTHGDEFYIKEGGGIIYFGGAVKAKKE